MSNDMSVLALQMMEYNLLNQLYTSNTDSSGSIADLGAYGSNGSTVSFNNILQEMLNGYGLSDSDESGGSDLLSSVGMYPAYQSYLFNNAGTSAIDSSGNRSPSDQLVAFIAAQEGFSATPYRGADSQNLTIGYGHVIEPGENYTSLTKSQALDLLKSDLQTYADSVNKEFGGENLTQNQFDALVSFSYNEGAYIWDKAPQLTNDIKSGASSQVIKSDLQQFTTCNGSVLQGLANRRLDEWNMFANGQYRMSI